MRVFRLCRSSTWFGRDVQTPRSRTPSTPRAPKRFSRTLPADFVDYLPFDTFHDADRIIAALSPSALVFSKLDIWPALTERAAAAGVAVGVISATLPESSGRRGLFARAALGDAYRSIERVGAIDEKDAERLREQGVRSDRIGVTGDTRYDQVWSRSRRPTPALVQSLRSARPTLVAGSTWPTDEEHLLPAWTRIREKIPDARLIIAPHESSDAHLRSIEAWARRARLTSARIDAREALDADIVLVDRYGILGDLYSIADVAYVGGGFQSAGLHSVLEPAAFGAPVLFGPRNERSRDAARLVEAGGGAIIGGEIDLSIRLADWLGSPSGARCGGGFRQSDGSGRSGRRRTILCPDQCFTCSMRTGACIGAFNPTALALGLCTKKP